MISRKISNFAINKYTTSRKIAGMKSNIFDNMIAMIALPLKARPPMNECGQN